MVYLVGKVVVLFFIISFVISYFVDLEEKLVLILGLIVVEMEYYGKWFV